MTELLNEIDRSLARLDVEEWKKRLIGIGRSSGGYRDLGFRHFAVLIDRGPSLLVTFETVQGIRSLSEQATPLGFDLVRSQGWSHLCFVSDGDTWFRDASVHAYLDRLVDEAFFDQYDNVVFYGAGPCGYAAAAYSVIAPGATVVAVQPQATLAPDMTEWDPRFAEMRRISFTDRYGYAPDMLDAAEEAFVLYDPRQEYDAMHAALFARPNVTRLRLPFLGAALQTQLMEMGILTKILERAGSGTLTPKSFYRLYRARRDNPSYLRALMGRLDSDDRPFLNALLCRNVVKRMNAPRFRRRLDMLEQQAEAGEFVLPSTAA
ncbi:phosphoadenosine phosphosulfate reductase [Seohaeicola zhoushanensis]|uniref:Phosphoadenosine phosphosulfate reductase n=1 Tax=Seohaeicola zhoushanensis TaxID=1569283 RepID=A0A8J3GVT8_9RHOB|nr:phosphoadenosine phosphosulfate reductase [Seohaeicola zhoushanensis]GHF41841.1 hypothetical protein GCM10017056_11870 [Seohaeicola zhoushanensis]